MTAPREVSCEVVVVGAGSAGSAVAAGLAAAGREVILVDQRPREQAGARWINAVPGWCFDEAELARPGHPEAVRPAGRHNAILADAAGRARVVIPADPGVMIEMGLLIARLQEQALESGARYLQGRVVALREDPERVRGVILEKGETSLTINALLTVDASGQAGVVRGQTARLARHWPGESSRDLCLAAQYQFRVADQAQAEVFLARHEARPGDGIAWAGVAGGYSILQISVAPDLDEVGILAGAIPADGHPTGALLVERCHARHRWIGARLRGGQGVIPLGRPFDRLTAPGVALIGDAARQVYAVHGSGVGMHLVAARELVRAVAGVPDPGDPAVLHRYAARYLRRYGGRLAAANLFRRLSQSLSGERIAELLASSLITPALMSPGLLQHPLSLDFGSIRPLLGPGLRHPSLAVGLLPTALRMTLCEPLYRTYPDRPDERALERFARLASWLGLG